MNCQDLFDQPVAKFIHSFRQSPGVIVFQHVPKTAGSSVGVEFSETPRGFMLQWDQLESSWNQFLGELKNGQIDHVRGHLWFHQINDLQSRHIPHRAVCFLRHPIARLISHFRYDRTPANPNHQEIRAKYPTFSSFADYIGDNFMTRMIAGPCDSSQEAIRRIKNRFKFVGLTEHFHASMVVLMGCLGRPYRIKPKTNVTRANQVGAKVEISDDYRAELLERNAIDLKVFQYFQQQYQSLSESILEYVIASQTSAGVKQSAA